MSFQDELLILMTILVRTLDKQKVLRWKDLNKLDGGW